MVTKFIFGSTNIDWVGTSDERESGNTLVPYFAELMAEIKTQKALVDFRNLEYMNTSTVRPILHLLQKLRQEKSKC